jgi:tRNA(Ile)-lysidine synthase
MSELSKGSTRRKAPAGETSGGRRTGTAAKGPIGLEEARQLLSPMLASGQRILIAVSGGPDSVALMRLCALVATAERAAGPQVATVDHGLRENARSEAEQVGRWAQDCGLTHAILTWEGRKPSTRIQERARAARYALLHRRMREIAAVLLVTAHTLDDQAETVLMRMAHGSGLAGLAGMRFFSEREGLAHARPLLGIPKARLVATCRINGWPFLEDPSNRDPRFARARWRKLLPVLEREGLTAERIARLAERADSVDAALRMKAEEAFAAACAREGTDILVLDMVRLVRREPREVALRMLLHALETMPALEHRVPVRLERVENVLCALNEAFEARKGLKRTLGGAILAYDGAERLTLRREGARRRGRRHGSGPPHANEGNSIALSPLV